MSRGDTPATPCTLKELRRVFAEGPETLVDVAYSGLTIREHFASQIMAELQGAILNCEDAVIEKTRAGRAEHAVAEADALLAELAKP